MNDTTENCNCDACKSWRWSTLPDSISPNVAEADRPIDLIAQDAALEAYRQADGFVEEEAA